MAFNSRQTIFSLALLLVACHRAKPAIPDLQDEPTVAKVKVQDLAEMAPAYGVAMSAGTFEVSLEPGDSKKVKVGQPAFVSETSDGNTNIECRVTSVTHSASSEVGQAIAWLRAVKPSNIQSGDFVYGRVVIDKKKSALSVPRGSIYVKDGATMVLKQTKSKDGKISFSATEVELGIESNDEVEIRTGLTDQDQVILKGGIGYLFPNFKEADD